MGSKGAKLKDPKLVEEREREKKEAAEKKKITSQPKQAAAAVPSDIKEIVRVMATDLKGMKRIGDALRSIKGISFSTARLIAKRANISTKELAGHLKEDEIKRIESVIKELPKTVPAYMLNSRKDATGTNRHLTGSDLDIETRQIVADLKKYGSYRGWRHRLGQPVRGQRTRSSFRRSGTVGVVRAKAKPGEGSKEAK